MTNATITAVTKARIALFNREAKADDNPEKNYPIMTGFIENNSFKVSVSAFLKMNTDTGKKFLSLVIRNENDEQTFGGTLFKSEKAGKEGTYYGYISEQFEDEIDGKRVFSSSEWQLGISAKIKTPEGKKKHIGGDVYPLNRKANGAESADDESGDVAF